MKVIVGISGGVDSAITAWHLQQAGMEVEGCYIITRKDPEEIERVHQICAFLKIPCCHIYKEEVMNQTIILPMVRDYGAGKTPNPCLHCNAVVKFPALMEFLAKEKAQAIATGHYVQKRGSIKGFVLKQGKDAEKDQSYMLSLLPRENLQRLLLPLGAFQKKAIRKTAVRVFGSLFHSIPESQDICFMKKQNIQEYIEQKLCPQEGAPGLILSDKGEILGKHKGLFRYTIGQRKGLGLSGGPWFVYDISKKTNTLYVGSQEVLNVNKIRCIQTNWFLHPNSLRGFPLQAKVRYRGKSIDVRSFSFEKGILEVKTIHDFQGVAPGQGLVLYAEDIMVCGAIIQEVERRSSHEAKK